MAQPPVIGADRRQGSTRNKNRDSVAQLIFRVCRFKIVSEHRRDFKPAATGRRMLQPAVAAGKLQEAAATLLNIIDLCVENLSLHSLCCGVSMVFQRLGGLSHWLDIAGLHTAATLH